MLRGLKDAVHSNAPQTIASPDFDKDASDTFTRYDKLHKKQGSVAFPKSENSSTSDNCNIIAQKTWQVFSFNGNGAVIPKDRTRTEIHYDINGRAKQKDSTRTFKAISEQQFFRMLDNLPAKTRQDVKEFIDNGFSSRET